MNYIGLATLVALGLVLLTGVAGVMSFGQQVFVGLARLHHRGPHHPVRRLALARARCSASLLVAAVALFLGAITLRLSGHYLPISHHRLGHRHLFHVRQHGDARQAHRPARICRRSRVGGVALDSGRAASTT